MNGGGFKISIPTTLRKTIEDIKEITAKHSEEEVYAMLKECSMDPNETVQKLLLQDPFHEVKRKRDRKKENANSRESMQLRWKNGMQGRALQGGRVHFPPRAVLHNAVGGCNSWSVKDSGIIRNVEQCSRLSLSTSNGAKEIEESPVMSEEPVINNGSTNMASESGIKRSSAASDITNLGRTTTSALLPAITNTNPTSASCTHDYVNNSVSTTSSSSAECFLSADPVMESSFDSLLHSTEANSKHEMKSQLPVDESISVNPMEKEFVVSNQDREPKSGISVNFQGSKTDFDGKTACQSPPAFSVLNPDEVTSNLEKKLAQSQLVILPKVIQIPESERPKLSFGSFSFGFGVTNSYKSEADVLNSSTIMPETSYAVEETFREKASSGQVALVTGGVGDYVDDSQTNGSIPETLASGEGDTSFGPIHKSKHVKEEALLLPGGYQTSLVPTSPIYSLGFAAPPVGVQVVSSENSDSQEPDVSCFPNFTVQCTYDPTNYYSQQYCITTDISGHYSTFPSSVVATKYNGNGTDSPPSVESTHEGAAVVTQAAGIVQSSIPVNQQSIPAFGPPIGMPLSHYPPSYFPYGHYFSPFYVSPTAIHQFLGNNTFMQFANGSVYPSPPPPTASVISTTKEDLGASQLKETNVCITGPQGDGSVLRVAAPCNEISRFLPGSLCNFPLPGKHVMFTSTQTGHSPSFAGFYHPAQAVATSTFYPILQQSQAVAVAADLVATESDMDQLHQHPHINWPMNH